MKRIPDPWGRAATAALIACLVSASGLLQSVELAWRDALFSLNLHAEPSDLSIVEIDSDSLRELNSWPWPRGYHAKLLDRLVQAGAARIAFDVDFSSHSNAAQDRMLSEALRRAPRGRVFLPAFSQVVSGSGARAALAWVEPLPIFAAHSALATVNLVPDPDGILRSLLPHTGAAFANVPSLNEALSGPALELGDHFLIDFSIDTNSFRRLSYADVLRGDFDPRDIAGRKVLIGATAVELGDRFATPIYRSLPGVYVQALAYQSASKAPLRVLPPTILYPALIALITVFCLLSRRLKWRFQLVLTLGLCVATLLAMQLLFKEFRLLLPAATFISGVVLAQIVTWLNSLDRQTLDLIRQSWLLSDRTATLRAIVDNSMDAILVVDGDGDIHDANRAAAALLKRPPAELRGTAVSEFVSDWYTLLHRHVDRNNLRVHASARINAHMSLPVELSIGRAAIDGQPSWIVFLRDITRQLEAQRELEYRASHDSLTTLANRCYIEQRLEELTCDGTAAGRRLAFLLVDLDHFKEINDTLGHPTGDRVLLKVAARMRQFCDDDWMVARIGGDEFGILCEGGEDIERIAQDLLTVIREPLRLDAMTVEVGASIGISLFPDDADDDTTLIQHADVAMYLAKELSCGYRFYDAAADRHSVRRLSITAQLREAIKYNQFYLVLQPKVTLADRRLVGAEALIRWRHPELGNIPPSEFIPIAEQTGMIEAITDWLLGEILNFIRAHRPELEGLSIAINISARSLADRCFPETLAARMRAADVQPGSLALEITETALIDEPDAALDVIERLNAAGLMIEIDDFGTGYSSLSYLSRFRAHRLKIDSSFVIAMVNSPTDRTIVAASIDLAHRLGMQTIAEGIEDETLFEQLREMGCDYGQGYGIDKPMTADAFLEKLGREQYPAVEAV